MVYQTHLYLLLLDVDDVARMRVYDIPVYFLSSRCSNRAAISKEAIADAIHTCDALALNPSDVCVLRPFWTARTEVEWLNRCPSNRRRLNAIQITFIQRHSWNHNC
jgi:hypothetical protein